MTRNFCYQIKSIIFDQKRSKSIKNDQNRPKLNQDTFFIMKFETGKLNKIVIKEQIEILIQKFYPKSIRNLSKMVQKFDPISFILICISKLWRNLKWANHVIGRKLNTAIG